MYERAIGFCAGSRWAYIDIVDAADEKAVKAAPGDGEYWFRVIVFGVWT